ncbi:peptide deformylase [Loigolactobacillus binensis]|uniref:Peptide deformylase n=1 Tax=Loigolactobacillus binensis TaxID=2559922 RepID=A0ABW3E8A5_9LACO|nr:peptide deformylase [Loigolactobacillus binensis]
MQQPIVHDPTFLAQKAVLATKADTPVITNLLDTLTANAANCVGMAANMIGVNKRIIVCQMGPLAVPLVNPVITKKSGAFTTEEGCLSLTGQRSTTRYQQITVKYTDQNFNAQQQVFSGWIAQIIQHEIDHCEGILI